MNKEVLTLWGEKGSERSATARVLRMGRVVRKQKLTGGSNVPWLATFEYEGIRRRGVVKMVRDESLSLRYDASIEYMDRMDLAVAWIAEALEYEAVPVVCVRKLNLNLKGEAIKQEGMVMEYIKSKWLRKFRQVKRYDPEGLEDLLAFDLIIWNLDRHASNVMVDKKEDLVAIDHGMALSFSVGRELRVITRDRRHRHLSGPVSDDFRDKLRAFLGDEMRQELLIKRLRGLLTTDQIDALFARMWMVDSCLQTDGNLARIIDYIDRCGVEDPSGSNLDKYLLYTGKADLR